MPPARLLLTLVVLTAALAVRRPALAATHDVPKLAGDRTTWVQRLGSGVARTFGRIGLMQRVALQVPTPRPTLAAGHSTRPAAPATPDPLRTCLPPPAA